jgi:hypothetical protein
MDRGPIFRPDSSLRELGPPASPRDAGPAPAIHDDRAMDCS